MKRILLVLFAATATAQSPSGTTQRVYLMGNSLTHNLRFDAFEETVKADGRGLVLGRHTSAGIYLDWFWKNPNKGFTVGPYGCWGQAWREYEWDAVSLQPFWKPYNECIKHAKLLVAELYKKSPNAQVYIYVQWPRVNGGNYYRDWWSGYDRDKAGIYCKAWWEDYARELTEAFPNAKPVKLIPVGHVLYLLDQKMRAGLVPGFDSIFAFYADNLHLNSSGSYVIGATFYATLYGRNPRTVPMAAYQKPKPGDSPISDKLAQLINETVWQVVATHPRTGIHSQDPLEIVTPLLEPAVVGEPYRLVLQQAYGRAPYAWSLVRGQLPKGLVFGEDGVISGETGKTGETTFTARVRDSAGTAAEREFTLAVLPDSAPKIRSASLPDIRCGEPVRIRLEAEGGNPPLIWKGVTEVPPGLDLTSDGVISGTAGKPGDYRFKVAVSDSDAKNPESADTYVTLKVTPPGPDVLMTQVFDPKKNPITIDGKLDEPMWTLDRPIKKLVKGKTFANQAVFGALWCSYRLYLAIKVMDDDIQTGNGDPERNDSVEIFIDSANNREKVYNADDHRFIVDASGKLKVIGNSRFTKAAASRIDGGYIVEIEISGHDLAGLAAKKPWSVMGLDIAVNDVDHGAQPSQVVWQGNADNATVPDCFGTAVFCPKE